MNFTDEYEAAVIYLCKVILSSDINSGHRTCCGLDHEMGSLGAGKEMHLQPNDMRPSPVWSQDHSQSIGMLNIQFLLYVKLSHISK